MCETVSAVSVCRGREAESAPWRVESWALGPEELAERQSSYFPYTSSHIQLCSLYLTKHLHPRCNSGTYADGAGQLRCVCACVFMFGSGLHLRISHHASDFCTPSIRLSWQLKRKLINQVCLGEKHKTKNRLTHSALRQGRRVTPCHSEMQKKWCVKH